MSIPFNLPQALSVGIVLLMVLAFIWGKWRYDLISLLALLCAVAVGVVPYEKAFSGFADDVVIIVASALVVSRAISRTGIADRLVRRSLGWLTTTQRQVMALTAAVLTMSAFIKNIGALSMVMPAAYQFGQRTRTPVSRLLMPMSFASLLGGVTTLVGTSPNIIVSHIRQQMTGQGFQMFDFTAVGLPIALIGFLFLSIGFRLIPVRKTLVVEDVMAGQAYTVEAIVPDASNVVGKPARTLAELSSGEVAVTSIVRQTHTRMRNPVEQVLLADDHVLLHGVPDEIDTLIQRAGLSLPRENAARGDVAGGVGEMAAAEAVITSDSLLVGWSPAQLRLSDRFATELIGVQRRGGNILTRLKSFRFAVGDVIVIRCGKERLPQVMKELDLLPLGSRDISFGKSRNWVIPVLILAAAMGLMAAKLISVPLAFFGAAVLTVVSGTLSVQDSYDALDPPVLVTLAALIPISDSLRETGASDIISGWLSANAAALPPVGALALIMIAAMIVTPFLNNAATVLFAAPVAVTFAQKLGYAPDPFLMAVALGAACDFLTPVGHQCNMLVMGPGGYRFGDYWRLGLPLSVLVVLAGVPLIAWFWPISG